MINSHAQWTWYLFSPLKGGGSLPLEKASFEKLRDTALYPILADFIEEGKYLAKYLIKAAERITGRKYRFSNRKKWAKYHRAQM